MSNFYFTKGVHEEFDMLSPRQIFLEHFGKHPNNIYTSEYAFYDDGVYDRINDFFDGDNVQTYVYNKLINCNKDLVRSEMVYINSTKNYIVCLNHYWDTQNYAIEADDIDEADNAEENLKKNDLNRPQIFIAIYSSDDIADIPVFLKTIISTDKKPVKKERELNLICYDDRGPFLKPFKTNDQKVNIDTHYNDDFKEVSNNIIHRLNEKDGQGIVLLHSDPGCGKTTYLRYLTQIIENKKIIYLPPDMTARLANPEFMHFFMSHPNSVLLMEDAESSLMKRGASGNQAVSNLLNTSDGLLGDALKIQIVCTFNCKKEEIDEALLRPGRLIAEYKFEPLSLIKTKNLAKTLFKEENILNNIKEPMNLADIYSLDQKKFVTEVKRNTIGFQRNA